MTMHKFLNHFLALVLFSLYFSEAQAQRVVYANGDNYEKTWYDQKVVYEQNVSNKYEHHIMA